MNLFPPTKRWMPTRQKRGIKILPNCSWCLQIRQSTLKLLLAKFFFIFYTFVSLNPAQFNFSSDQSRISREEDINVGSNETKKQKSKNLKAIKIEQTKTFDFEPHKTTPSSNNQKANLTGWKTKTVERTVCSRWWSLLFN
jgi:predicted DsbA family dithiol-disulfide isomerase